MDDGLLVAVARLLPFIREHRSIPNEIWEHEVLPHVESPRDLAALFVALPELSRHPHVEAYLLRRFTDYWYRSPLSGQPLRFVAAVRQYSQSTLPADTPLLRRARWELAVLSSVVRYELKCCLLETSFLDETQGNETFARLTPILRNALALRPRAHRLLIPMISGRFSQPRQQRREFILPLIDRAVRTMNLIPAGAHYDFDEPTPRTVDKALLNVLWPGALEWTMTEDYESVQPVLLFQEGDEVHEMRVKVRIAAGDSVAMNVVLFINQRLDAAVAAVESVDLDVLADLGGPIYNVPLMIKQEDRNQNDPLKMATHAVWNYQRRHLPLPKPVPDGAADGDIPLPYYDEHGDM